MTESSEIGAGVFLRVPYMAVLKDVVAAVVCSQIHYWYMPAKKGGSKLRVYKDGKWWIAKSRREWGNETGLSDAQVRRALEVLERRAVIEKRNMKFNGAPTLHVRALNVAGQVLQDGCYLIPGCVSDAKANQAGMCNKTDATCHQLLVTGSQSITESTQETKQETVHHNLASSDAEDDLLKTNQQPNPEEISSKKDGLFKFDEPVQSKHPESLWEVLCNKYRDRYGEFLAPSLKDRKGLKMLSESMGNRFELVLSFVFEKWIGFGKYAKERSGAYSIPQVPTISFLIRYPEAALNYWLQENKHSHGSGGGGPMGLPAKNHQAIKAPTVELAKSKQPQSVKEDDDDKPITLEELLAMKPFIKMK